MLSLIIKFIIICNVYNISVFQEVFQENSTEIYFHLRTGMKKENYFYTNIKILPYMFFSHMTYKIDNWISHAPAHEIL